jgi:hypothetical protein
MRAWLSLLLCYGIASPAHAQCAPNWVSAGVPGTDFDNSALCIGETSNGDLVVGGTFSSVDGVPCSGIARHDGVQWSSFGNFTFSVSGIPFPLPPQLNALARTGNGDLLAGGIFSNVDNMPNTAGVARRTQAGWQSLGSGLGGFSPPSSVAVWGIATTANGDAIVCGQFPQAGGLVVNNVARWNGSSWQGLGGGTNGRVDRAVELPNGDIVVCGTFTQAGGVNAVNIARWNGTAWSAFGGLGASVVSALAVLPSGELVAGGSFPVSRWLGAFWLPLGGGVNAGVTNLVRLPDGDLLATGPFTVAGGTPAAGIARWTGAAWQPVAGGLTGFIEGIHQRQSGDIVVVGNLGSAAGQALGELATLRTPCPATALAVGAGCAGSNGIDTLQPTTLPWTGSVLRTVARGLPTNGIAVVVFGNSGAQVPLASILPVAPAGCDLLASPDLLEARLIVGSEVRIDFPIPDLVALAGYALRQQTVALAVDAQGSLSEATSSNALALTLGTW